MFLTNTEGEEARQIATARMAGEAEKLGADAVVQCQVRHFSRNAGGR